MKRLGFHLQKGGVGKTSVSVTLAYRFARMGYKTIIIDADYQGNATSWVLKDPPEHTLYDVLSEAVELEDAITPVEENLDIIGTHRGDKKLTRYGEVTLLSEDPNVFREINGVLADIGYDFVVYDLSPGFGSLNKKVLEFLDEVVAIVTPKKFSADGMATFAEEITLLKKKFDSRVVFDKIICNDINKSKNIHRDILAQLQDAWDPVYTVRTDVKIEYAQDAGMPIWDYSEVSKFAKDFIPIAEALV